MSQKWVCLGYRPGDEAGIIELYRRVFKIEVSLELWRWAYHTPPTGPAIVAVLERAEQARRHEVMPGVTGWAQLNRRNAISWERKFELDVWYVDHQSFCLDSKILFRTAWHVLHPSNVNAPEHATMPEFGGTGPGTFSSVNKSDRF